MAKSENLNKGVKIATRNKVIVGIVVAVLICAILGYFIYILGIVPKYKTGMKVTGTINTVNGAVSIDENISVLEAQYHYREVYNAQAYLLYYQYGITDFDEVADAATGATFNDLLYDSASNEILNLVVLNELADRTAEFHSAADRFTDMSIANIRTQAEGSNYGTADRLLQANYGTGMTVNQYRSCMEREIRGMEFEAYMKQFVLIANSDEIEAAYAADPTAYENVTFHTYYFPYEVDENGEVTDTEEAMDKAETLLAAVEGGDDFRAATIDIIGEDVENITTLSGFGYTTDPETGDLVAPEEDMVADPTIRENWTFAEAESYHFSDFLYAEDTEAGDATIIEADTCVYVVLLETRETDNTPTATYRTLTLNTGIDPLTATPEQISAAIASTTERANNLIASAATSYDFVNLIKENTDVADEIIDGGYHDCATEESLADNTELATWLFAEGRTAGETTIIPSVDGSTITIYYVDNIAPAWMYTAQLEANTALINAWSADITSAVTCAIDYDAIKKFIY